MTLVDLAPPAPISTEAELLARCKSFTSRQWSRVALWLAASGRETLSQVYKEFEESSPGESFDGVDTDSRAAWYEVHSVVASLFRQQQEPSWTPGDVAVALKFAARALRTGRRDGSVLLEPFTSAASA